jgi:hypothetical protein
MAKTIQEWQTRLTTTNAEHYALLSDVYKQEAYQGTFRHFAGESCYVDQKNAYKTIKADYDSYIVS